MKKIELSIPKPCHENWEKMTQEARGKFCGSCQKTVIDFTTMSDSQLAQFFKKRAGSVCGRFGSDQLNRVVEVPRKRLPWIRHFFTIALPAILFSCKAGAQGEVRVGKVAVCTQPVKGDTVVSLLPSSWKERVIKGQVLNENGEPIEHASIRFKGTRHSVMVDAKGRFEIKQMKEEHNQIEVAARGYRMKTVALGYTDDLVITLSNSYYELMGMVVPVIKKRDTLPPLMQPKNRDTAFSHFSVYPNPVISNSVLAIEVKDVESGRYEIAVVTSTGEVLQNEVLTIEQKIKKYSLNIRSVPAGTYFVRLTNKKNGKSSTEIIIVQ